MLLRSPLHYVNLVDSILLLQTINCYLSQVANFLKLVRVLLLINLANHVLLEVYLEVCLVLL
jgi:hypothetical protein